MQQTSTFFKSLPIVLMLLCQFANQAGAQKKISFQALRDGLSNNHIKCIFQDSKGFMWFGTYDGLNKFDGNNFVNYENSPSDSNSLSHNYISAIVEDRFKNIWVGTSNGLNLYNRDKDNFTKVKPLQSFSFLCISTLFLDESDNLWIGTAGNGLIIYNIKNQKVTTFLTSSENKTTISSNFVTRIVKDKHKRIWLGTRNGLNLMDFKTQKFSHFVNDENDPESLSQNHVMALNQDNQGNLWIGTYGGGLNKLEERNGNISFKHYIKSNNTNGLSNNYILSLCPDRKGNLWIGTENGGLNYLNISTDVVDHYYAEDGNSRALISNSIWTIYEDKEGIVWIGTYNKGINIIDEHYNKFELYQKDNSANKNLVNNDIKCFGQDRSGNLWIATDGGGICGFNPIRRQFYEFEGNNKLSTNSITSLLVDNKGNIWAGTWAYGIDKFDNQGNKIKNYICTTRKNLRGNINCMYQLRNGTILAGSSGNGLFRLDVSKDEFVPIINVITNSHLNPSSFISSIREDSNNNLWIGTYYGLICMTPGDSGNYKFKQYLHSAAPGSLSSSLVKTIYEDSRNQIWVGTENGLDLFSPKDGTFIHFTKQNGLPNNCINSILEDNHKNLWLGTNKGISKFNTLSKTFKNFTKDDGLNSNELSLGACIKLANGCLIFGGIKGFNMFYPDSIQYNTRPPLVYITNIRISNRQVKIGAENSPLQKNISETHKIALTYKQSSFAIEFVAINYTRSSRNQYKYILEGFDKKWIDAGTNHVATYTNIDAGTYVFKVMGSNNDGIWNNTPLELEITVLPPFWETGWAYSIYFLIVGLLLYGFLRLWMIKTEQAQRLKFEKLQREQEEHLSKLKIQFFANVSHELRTPLTLIISPLEHIISSGTITGKLKQQLSLVYRNTERLFRLVNELMDFSKFEENKLKLFIKQLNIIEMAHEVFYLFKEEANQKQIHYSFETEVEQLMIWADKNKLEKVFMNLLSNAFKYTPENGFIKMVIRQNNPQTVTIQIINSGQGIPPQYIHRIFERFYQIPDNEQNTYSGTGIGLALVKDIIDLHHGQIDVSSEINSQTCFTVTLTTSKEHFNELDLIKEADVENGSIRKLTSTGKKTDTSGTQKPHEIMIVEDNAELRSFLVSVLNEDYTIIEAPDGETGFMLLEEKNPDLIISDILMPKMSGLELCRKLKMDIATSHIPIILLTSRNTIEDQIEGIETGADTYITKPFNVSHLKATVKNLIETRRKLFQRFSQDVYILPKEVTTNKYDQKFLEQAIAYINTNIQNEDISVEGLAACLTMNRSNVYRKIKALTGQSATEFIRTVRLKMAIKYLESGEFNVSEISYKVGFASPAYFTKCFKEQFGKLPSDFLSKNSSQ